MKENRVSLTRATEDRKRARERRRDVSVCLRVLEQLLWPCKAFCSRHSASEGQTFDCIPSLFRVLYRSPFILHTSKQSKYTQCWKVIAFNLTFLWQKRTWKIPIHNITGQGLTAAGPPHVTCVRSVHNRFVLRTGMKLCPFVSITNGTFQQHSHEPRLRTWLVQVLNFLLNTIRSPRKLPLWCHRCARKRILHIVTVEASAWLFPRGCRKAVRGGNNSDSCRHDSIVSSIKHRSTWCHRIQQLARCCGEKRLLSFQCL